MIRFTSKFFQPATKRCFPTAAFCSSSCCFSSFRHCSSATKEEAQSENNDNSNSNNNSNSNDWKQLAGKLCGIIIPFTFVWYGTSFIFGSCQQQQGKLEIVQPAAATNKIGGGVQLGGPFEMIDCSSGKVVTDADVLISDEEKNGNKNENHKWSLLYFGFTKCAEVCPRNLKFMTNIIETLQQKAETEEETKQAKEQIQVVFISVDPIRDTAPVLQNYLSEKVPKDVKWIGLCGDEAQVSKAAGAWRVYYSSMNESEEEKLAREEKGMTLEEALGSKNENYQLDHSAAVYFVAPNGKLHDLFFEEMGAENAADRAGLHLSGWCYDE